MTTSSENPTLFVRKATGLVRAWSVFDAFIYATFSINLITLGLYIFSQMYFLKGGLLPTLLISGAFILFEVITYAAMIAVMPRSGGDYVRQSRVLGGGVGFVLAITGWWFILWLWVPLYGDMLRHIVLTPLLGIAGAKDLALWFVQKPEGLFLTCVLLCALVTGYIALGMNWYARIQRFCFWGGMVGLVCVMAFLLFGSPTAMQAGLERTGGGAVRGAAGGIRGHAQGGRGGRRQPAAQRRRPGCDLSGDALHRLFQPLAELGRTSYGEVRGATDFKRNYWGMALALIFTTVLAMWCSC